MTVSVIVPAFNCSLYLADTLESLRLQTEKDIEVIVVNDGSTDDTGEIAAGFSGRDARFITLNQANSGKPSIARNRGIRASTGEFIAFLDGDDLYHPKKIELQLAAFHAHPDIDLMFGDVVTFHDGEQLETLPSNLVKANFVEAAREHMEQCADGVYVCKDSFYPFISTEMTALCTQSNMIRRSALDREPTLFREDWKIGEDIDLWFRLAKQIRIGFQPITMSYYRLRPGSLMTDSMAAVIGAIQAHSANLARARGTLSAVQETRLRRRIARQHNILAHMLLEKGEAAAARDSYLSGRDLSPADFSKLNYLKTFIPKGVRKMLAKRRN